MKTMIIALFILTASTALAETYKWEDKDGIHFTENLYTVPKKYRTRAIAEARGDLKGVPVISTNETTQQRSSDFLRDGTAMGEAKAAVYDRMGYIPVDFEKNPNKYLLPEKKDHLRDMQRSLDRLEDAETMRRSREIMRGEY